MDAGEVRSLVSLGSSERIFPPPPEDTHPDTPRGGTGGSADGGKIMRELENTPEIISFNLIIKKETGSNGLCPHPVYYSWAMPGLKPMSSDSKGTASKQRLCFSLKQSVTCNSTVL